ncbi:DNA-binding response regulator, OmpR family, contains REC and winged-helix (wHTH) domain [Ruminococcaceae bacterium YRB3002]|nr:DNA-binding response regulator, OmpR family, contains REC and winged-helix (wHTH) domain [Ruminococcaceae bacterium YRB3002]
MVSILIIEDDTSISNLIVSTLVREGYKCDAALDGRTGLDLYEKGNYDLILLDLMLPEISGYNLLEIFREGTTPVIVISAMNQVQDRIRGLKMGADDYLSKPFQIGELVARVESVLRRTNKASPVITIGDVTVNTDSRAVTKGGIPVELTTKEFDLLVLLIQNKNVALNRSYLYESVWHDWYNGDTRTLDNHIQRLRKKLDWADTIETVFRIGYRLKVR